MELNYCDNFIVIGLKIKKYKAAGAALHTLNVDLNDSAVTPLVFSPPGLPSAECKDAEVIPQFGCENSSSAGR